MSVCLCVFREREGWREAEVINIGSMMKSQTDRGMRKKERGRRGRLRDKETHRDTETETGILRKG